MEKRILYAVHNLGLGDIIAFAPHFLLAMRKGYGVDVVYAVGEPAAASRLIFPAESSDGRIRFIQTKDTGRTRDCHYAVAIVGDRRCFATVLAMGGRRLGAAIPMPAHDHKHHLLFFYNHVMRPLLQIRGVRAFPRLPVRGRSVRTVVFEQLSEAMGAGPSLPEMVSAARSRVVASTFPNSRIPSAEKTLLVHAFREVPYRCLNPESLEVIAACLAEKFPSHKIIALAGGAWEREMAEAFAGACRQHGLECTVLTPSLRDVVRLAASATLFIGVDHGISHLASLVCRHSLVIYGGCRSWSDLHLLWPPQLEGKAEKQGERLTRVRDGERVAVMLHPSHEEYLSHAASDPTLINRIVTYDNVRMALRLATGERK